MKKLMRRFSSWLERVRLGDRKFAIVSNNCWGYEFYNAVGRPYNTPFVGLYLMPECYLAMLADFGRSISGEIVIGRQSRYHDGPRSYPVGLLPCGAEVHFLHYGTDADALKKWQRRCARLREALAEGTPLFLKLCDREGCTDEQLMRFHAVPFGAKVSFGVRPLASPNHLCVPRLRDRDGDYVGTGTRLYRKHNRCFDIVDWIRDGVVHRTPLSRLLGLVT